MAEFEDELDTGNDDDLEDEGAADSAGNGGAARVRRGEPTPRALAIRNLQRARKQMANPEGGASPLTDHLTQSPLVHAILDLADAVRGTKAPPDDSAAD